MAKSTVLEKTLIIFKPDLIQRGLVGTVIEQLENTGLKLLVAKMVKPDVEVIKHHYPGTKEWIEGMGHKTLASFKQTGGDVKEKFGTEDPLELGQNIFDRLLKYWQEGPVIVMVWEGPHAVSLVRKLRGHTIPYLAETGTFHAQFLYDSSAHAADLDRAAKTFIHASGDPKEAMDEIKYWFGTTEFKDYSRDIDKLYLA
jgi:nucleoside-diphosphate kinase